MSGLNRECDMLCTNYLQRFGSARSHFTWLDPLQSTAGESVRVAPTKTIQEKSLLEARKKKYLYMEGFWHLLGGVD